MTIAVAVFVAALGLIASERVDRTKVALVGALLVVLTGVLGEREAVEAVDLNTIGLLVGMMVMVRITEATGVYAWLAIRAGQLSRGRPPVVVLVLAATTAVLSAFLDNVTTILLIVPMTFMLADTLEIDPLPLVIVEIVASNIGGTATLIGDPPNILIAGHTGLSFAAFITNLAPIVVVALAVVIPGLYLAYRARLQVAPEARARLLALDAGAAISDAAEARRTVPILLGAILAFFAHQALHVEPATVALAGAVAMLCVSRRPVYGSVASIEWPTIFFLVGLFVMVGALEHAGALDEIAQGIAAVTGGDRVAELVGITAVSAVGSAAVDNIPFTAAMLPVVQTLAHDDAAWWALALGACFGGNATIVAAACNVAASGIAERAGHPIGFLHYLRVGVPVTVVSVLLAIAYVLLRYA